MQHSIYQLSVQTRRNPTVQQQNPGIAMQTGLTFFTNEPDATLLDRFKTTLTQVEYFDVLVGYFRSSGFHLLLKNGDPPVAAWERALNEIVYGLYELTDEEIALVEAEIA